LSDSVWKAELLLQHVDARWPNRLATGPAPQSDARPDPKPEQRTEQRPQQRPETRTPPTLKIVAPR